MGPISAWNSQFHGREEKGRCGASPRTQSAVPPVQGLGTSQGHKPMAEFRLSDCQMKAPSLPWGTSCSRMCQMLGGQGTECWIGPFRRSKRLSISQSAMLGPVRVSR